MWFKNIFIYRLPGDCKITAAALQEKLAFKPLMPCSGLDKQSRGWVSLACGGRLGWGAGMVDFIIRGGIFAMPVSPVSEFKFY